MKLLLLWIEPSKEGCVVQGSNGRCQEDRGDPDTPVDLLTRLLGGLGGQMQDRC